MTYRETATSPSPWLSGVADAVPIVVAYVPIAVTYGVLAQKAGLSTLNTMMMSVLVYAGSSQLVATGLFAAGAPAPSIILTTFVVNLRHLLLSAAIAPWLTRWRKAELAFFAYELTDETFALHVGRFHTGIPGLRCRKAETFAVNASAQISWLIGTGVGAALGQIIGDVEPFGLDYVLPSMFIALVVLQVENRVQLGIALLTGALSTILLTLGVGRWNVILATVVGATIGVLFQLWTNEPSS
jgi:4-azaleucine resistance transporter AzlC